MSFYQGTHTWYIQTYATDNTYVLTNAGHTKYTFYSMQEVRMTVIGSQGWSVRLEYMTTVYNSGIQRLIKFFTSFIRHLAF